ncbi:MAG TPA: twin-arginine translocase TatA/TatE family subunit [Candidatus Hydrogenedentes bacterium]|nr:MAG: Sec-independent protein translocase protein TatAd [Candidatus Hydrogenedentes bacterium ADurb.Bin170]HNZ47894.1 twin-arginine translocase TatA/TatE family subunit [Candidatus Hydrogenedentota bacterium]HOM47031.1 twin-arginine translocase TatA/TatE family subunit [Candidatus Hydrogenedentota bacterium]HOR49707.1 twin-arginine translocase TatA/TatE family subunit [Candidatus Hydrogenedentota bacterium]HPX86560.1 twin-arginine translocase TatA/TatE family subunit [Candidatus Hydrogenedent
MWAPGLGELVIIFVIVLTLFGGGKLAGVGKSLGQAISEFKSAVNEDKKEISAEKKEDTSGE